MIRQLADAANMITMTGIVLSVIAINLVVSGHAELAVVAALWALMADHLDGVVAARTRGRAPETGKIGKNLDSLADLVSAGVFPAVALIVVSNGSPLSVVAGAVLVVASALRLSYFNVFGLSGGRFIGVPTTYVVPVTAVMFLIRPMIPPNAFPVLLALGLAILAVLHVTPIRVPRTVGSMYAVVTVFCLTASLLLGIEAFAQN